MPVNNKCAADSSFDVRTIFLDKSSEPLAAVRVFGDSGNVRQYPYPGQQTVTGTVTVVPAIYTKAASLRFEIHDGKTIIDQYDVEFDLQKLGQQDNLRHKAEDDAEQALAAKKNSR